MAKVIFKGIIEKELEGLSREQLVQISGHFALLALPYLGSIGNFDFWKKDKIQKHLNSIFWALDLNILSTTANANAAAYANAYGGAYAAAAAVATDATATTYADIYAAASAANANAYAAASAAAYAANAATANATATAVKAATAAEAANADLIKTIHNLIQHVKDAKPFSFSTAIYGPIWTNFQQALRGHNCGYWADLYQQAFDNGFVFDLEELERRVNVPKEIREQGAAKVGEYLQKLKKGAKRLNQARIIILGDKGVGKTCVARRLVDPEAEMTSKEESTAGVDTSLWPIKVDDEEIQVGIWDFAGHTVTHAVHQFFLSERCLYIMVYNGRTDARERLTYWLDHMKNFGGDSKAIILINKHDPHKVKVPINFLKEQYPIAGFYEFSVKDDLKEFEKFRSVVSSYILNNPSWEKQEIPESYYEVKSDLEQLFRRGEQEKGKEFIKRGQFEVIAKKHGAEDPEQLLEDLHALGVSLWYKGMGEFGTLVLNPEWISQGVYKIINWVSNKERYGLSLEDFTKIFSDEAERYPEDKWEFLFELMEQYELAYQPKESRRLIIPHLLKEDRPAELPSFPIGESLKIQYKAEQPLPPNTISRFIVRHHLQIKKSEKAWRYGVILENGKGDLALVREEDRMISVSVKGPGKSMFIDELRSTLNDIFNSYRSEKPELQYRIQRFGEIVDFVSNRELRLGSVSNELVLSESKILNHIARDEPYFDDVTGQRLPLKGVANAYKIEATNVYIDSNVQNNQNTFNFHECNVGLQGSLNDLAMALQFSGHEEEAKKLQDTAKVLELAEGAKSKEEVKKKGIANWLKRVAEELGDEKSKLHKVVTGIEHGVGIAQDIAKRYNSIAEWLGMPVVPKPLLGEKKDDENEEESKTD